MGEKSQTRIFEVIDNIASLLRNDGIEPRITYNRHHVALGTTGYNFCWLHPRTAINHCHIEVRLRGDGERRDEVLTSLVNAGIDASARQADAVTFNTTTTALEEHSATITDVLKRAAETASAKS